MRANVIVKVALAVVLLFFLGAVALFAIHRLWSRAGPAALHSIAVLPFATSNDPQGNRALADGLHGDILAALAGLADLKVISPGSVLTYRPDEFHRPATIGRDLKVRYLLEGSVRQLQSRVRLTARLVDTRTESQVWAQRYDHNLDDIFSIRAQIAGEIAQELEARISPEEKSALASPPTTDLQAFELYHRARAIRLTANYGADFRQNMTDAIALLEQAVARDPKFLLAWAELAMAHSRLYFAGYDRSPPRAARAEEAMERVLALDPSAGPTHLAYGRHLYGIYRDYQGARRELEIARGLMPNNAEIFYFSGLIDRREGRWAESIQNMESALALDPLNWAALGQVAVTKFHLRDFAGAAAILDRALAIRPREPLTRISRAWAEYEARADLAPLHRTIDSILKDDPGAASTIAADWLFLALCERDFAAAERALAELKSGDGLTVGAVLLSRDFGAGLLARMRGDEAAARVAFDAARVAQEEEVRQQPNQVLSLSALGLIDAALGRKEEALAAGRQALNLLPGERDALIGSDIAVIFSIICAWTGERALALEYLRTSARAPSMVSYGKLKKHPWWTPLWGDPEYEKIVEELAPKRAQIERSTWP